MDERALMALHQMPHITRIVFPQRLQHLNLVVDKVREAKLQ